jgi:hypothetical protein
MAVPNELVAPERLLAFNVVQLNVVVPGMLFEFVSIMLEASPLQITGAASETASEGVG